MTIEEIAKNGIVGAGGAGFPTHVKLQSKPDYLILNAAECEPLLHKDEALLKNYLNKIFAGLRIAIELTGAIQAIIGIKEKHHTIIESLRNKLTENMNLALIGDFYPAGDEVTLVYLTTGRVIQPGTLPITVGCLVHNVETIYNIALNKPVIEKYISIAGAVENPVTITMAAKEHIINHIKNVHKDNKRVELEAKLASEIEGIKFE